MLDRVPPPEPSADAPLWLRRLVVAAALLLVLAAFAPSAFFLVLSLIDPLLPEREEVLASTIFAGKRFEVRATHFRDLNSFDTQGVRFESRPSGTGEGQYVHETRRDVAPQQEKDAVQMLNDKAAVIYYDSVILSTTDAGSTWGKWDANETLPNCGWPDRVCYVVQGSLKVDAGGRGRVSVARHYPDEAMPASLRLTTSDFGRTWRLAGTTP